MFYVSSKVKDKYGITDTSDGVEEFYTKKDILNLVNKFNIEISGIDTDSNICIVVPPNVTAKLFREGKIHQAISSMTIDNTRFGIVFRSKPNKYNFVNNAVINISRRGVNSYNLDKGTSSSFMSGLTLDDVLIILDNFENWSIRNVKIGGI